MAKVYPPISERRIASAGEHVEVDVLQRLADGLSDDYELFHGVDWARSETYQDSHGELDIVVINRSGDIAVLEVKAGAIEASVDGLFKRYGVERKDVGRQAGWQFGSILQRIKSEGLDVRLLHCLVLPHYRVGDAGTIGFPRERTADAGDCEDLAGFIQRRLGAGRPDANLERVRAFLLDRVSVQPDIAALAGALQRRVDVISGGLARWVPRMHVSGGVIHVRATAGSGKTQLALSLLRQACVAQQHASYVCFNRPLADQMSALAPKGVEVGSFHQLCWEAAGRPPGEQEFDELANRYLDEHERSGVELDVLVIDELQDMQPEWVQALISRVREDGRIYLLDDPEQCVYHDRAPLEIDGAVVVSARENYRSPRRIAETINLLRLTDEPIAPCAPIDGAVPTFTVYDDGGGSVERATADTVKRCLELGYALQDIVVLCWRGRQHSKLLARDTLGPLTLTKFTGVYDVHGRPVCSDGELTIETVRRFKGQSAPAIVLTEVDFVTSDAGWQHLLFVGLTRARMHVEVVISKAAADALAMRIASA
ncbi:MAG TPA: AAA family ATPase [Paraburkholderia sp.]|uniref:AAA family ATPase n=1 Tax=Paraburkholderia sp. TaxID=1926495 RepID=UPI002B48EED7|nr:AAA family ATPase [Paraburkholderia sp.]HKR46744.1 AAA family ATPase [Paraburkholderia sp.]